MFNRNQTLSISLEGVSVACTPGEAILIAEMAGAVAERSLPERQPRLEISSNIFELKPLDIKHPKVHDPFALFIELLREKVPLLFCYSSTLETDRKVMKSLRDAIHRTLVSS